MKKKRITALVLTGVMILSLVGCAGGQSSHTETQTAGTESTDTSNTSTGSIESDKAEKDSVRDDVVIYYSSEPDTLDQHDTTTVSAAVMIRNLYANLYRLNSNGDIVPELAESYRVNDDFSVYEITIKDGLRFSDGSDLKASDVAYSYNRAKSLGGTYYECLQEVTALDDNTVRITLTEPNSTFLNDLCVEYMCVMSENAVESGMDVDTCPTITSGAYTVEQWNKGESIILKANPYYFAGEPSIKTATIVYQLSEKSAYQALTDGSVDYLASVSSEEIPYLKADDDIELISYDNFAWNFLSLNENDPHFADDNVRRAIYYALDLNYIIDTALDGLGTPAPIIMNSSISGYLEGCDTVDYDLVKAKEFMAASAYPDGFDMTIEVGHDYWGKVAEEIGILLSEIGIKVTVEEKTLSEELDDFMDFSYTAGIMSYSMSSGTFSHATPLFKAGDALNFSCSPDGEIGDLLEKAAMVGEDERGDLLQEAFQQMKEKNLYIGLYWPTVYDAKTDALKQKDPVTSEKFIIANMYWEA